MIIYLRRYIYVDKLFFILSDIRRKSKYCKQLAIFKKRSHYKIIQGTDSACR